MDVSGQLHVLVALPPEKKPLAPTGQEAGWASVGLDAVVAKRKPP